MISSPFSSSCLSVAPSSSFLSSISNSLYSVDTFAIDAISFFFFKYSCFSLWICNYSSFSSLTTCLATITRKSMMPQTVKKTHGRPCSTVIVQNPIRSVIRPCTIPNWQ